MIISEYHYVTILLVKMLIWVTFSQSMNPFNSALALDMFHPFI